MARKKKQSQEYAKQEPWKACLLISWTEISLYLELHTKLEPVVQEWFWASWRPAYTY